LSRHYECSETDNSCDCTAGKGLFPLNLCSPIEAVGPRGTWQSLTLTSGPLGGTTVQVFLPDGSVTTTKKETLDGTDGTSTSQLTADDLGELNALIDGPAVRAALSDPVPCPLAFDGGPYIELALDTVVLAKDISMCLMTTHRVDQAAPLMTLTQKY
jgi:hypothetical protein